jgi:hypothetical protein
MSHVTSSSGGRSRQSLQERLTGVESKMKSAAPEISENSAMARTRPVGQVWRPARSAVRGVAWIGAVLAWAAAAVIATALAIVFAATLVVVAIMASGFVAAAAFGLRARRQARSVDPDLIEAHHVGGHSWVAYGWNGRA